MISHKSNHSIQTFRGEFAVHSTLLMPSCPTPHCVRTLHRSTIAVADLYTHPRTHTHNRVHIHIGTHICALWGNSSFVQAQGVDKIRLTGGEPLVRQGVVDLVGE
jgi:hypothetical protein